MLFCQIRGSANQRPRTPETRATDQVGPSHQMISLSPLLALLLAQNAPAQVGTVSWPAEFKASGSVGRLTQGDSYGGWRGSGGGSATWFLRRPVVDDGTPFALQSYLQRLDWLSLGFGGSGFAAKDDLTLYERHASTMNASLAGHFYVGPLVLGGDLYYETIHDVQVPAGQTAEEKHTTQLWYPDLLLGLRHESLEFLGTYRLKSYYDDGVARPHRWGQAALLLRSVLEDQLYWRIEAYTLVEGGGASFDVEVFPSQPLGVWFSGYIEQGQIYANSSTDYDRQGAEVGVGWWASGRFEMQFSLAFSSAKRTTPSTALTTAVATVGIVMRAPQRYREPDAPPPMRPPPVETLPLAETPQPVEVPVPTETPPPVETPPAEAPPPAPTSGNVGPPR
jgi:hypothetical protein